MEPIFFMLTDRQTDRKKLIVAFGNFANALNSPHGVCVQSVVLFQWKVENYKLHCSKIINK